MVDSKRSIAFVCNVDWFFISHRLPLAIYGIANGYDVIVMTKDTGRRKEIEAVGVKFVDIPFIRSGKNIIHELNCIRKLSNAYKEFNPTIIHHITLKAALLGSVAAKTIKHKRVVNAISGLGYNFTDGRDGFLQKTIKSFINIAFKSKDFRFILQNPDDVAMIKSMQLVPFSHIYLIKGSGVDLQEFPYTEPEKKEILSLLFPARLLYDKGLNELIAAANKLEDKLKGRVKFILAGDCDPGNLAAIKEEELKKKLIPGYLEWIGFNKDMYPVFAESDIVVLPSYREGLPKALIEACAVGRPIVTTDVPGCRECVENDVNGYLVSAKNSDELAEAIFSLVESDEKRLSFGLASRKLAEKQFSIEVVVEKTFAIYKKLINE